ncbi:MAG: hypothetical protein WD825_06895 [Gemmatimonadaceae bacterium]
MTHDDGETGSALDPYPEHARLIGLIIADWNKVEARFALLLMRAVGLRSQLGAKLIRPMAYAIASNSGRLGAMKAIAATAIPADRHRRQLLGLFSEAEKVLRLRNAVAHGIYTGHGLKVKRLDFRFEFGHPQSPRVVSLKELRGIHRRIRHLDFFLLELERDIREGGG